MSNTGTIRTHVIGGGLTALWAALHLTWLATREGRSAHVRLYHNGPLGGGQLAASPRCQCWLHRQGVLWAKSQPGVALGLQRATAMLARIVPEAIRTPPAFAVERAGEDGAEESFRVLGIEHAEVSARQFGRWFSEFHLPKGSRVFRTRDGALDLTLAVAGIARRLREQGVEIVHHGTRRLIAARGKPRS